MGKGHYTKPNLVIYNKLPKLGRRETNNGEQRRVGILLYVLEDSLLPL
jgi:hypothetical protein